MPAWLVALFARYGYAVVVAAVLLENAGVPAPGHTVVLAGGALAQQGHLSLTVLLACAILAAIAGDTAGYWIGRRGGRTFLLRHGPKVRLTPARLERAEQFFARHGAKTVVIGRFITGLQTVVALLAGSSGMPWWRFFRFNVAGAIVWGLSYGLAGYFFGASWHVLEKWVGRAGIFLVAALALGALVFHVRKRRSEAEPNDTHLAGSTIQTLAGAGAVVASLALCATLSRAVVERAPGPVDLRVSLALHSLDSPLADVVGRGASMLGHGVSLLVITLLFSARTWRRNRRAQAILVFVVTFGAWLASWAVTRHFGRAGPTLFVEVLSTPRHSFPARPVLMSLLVYGLAWQNARALGDRATHILRWAAITVPVVVGTADVFLGRHWVTDVIAGYLAGAAILLVSNWLLGRACDLEGSGADTRDTG
ncbi:VTT domain-containing protein [Lysobacter xanthus]